MKSYLLAALLLFLFIIAGCQTKEAEETGKENAGRLEKIDRDIATASEAITGLKTDIAGRIASLQSEIGAMKRCLINPVQRLRQCQLRQQELRRIFASRTG